MTDAIHELSSPHHPVLLEEIVDWLNPQSGGVYFDGTLGRGGHARAVIARGGSGTQVVATDRDPQALAAAATWPECQSGALRVFHSTFGRARSILAAAGVEWVDGMLLDLGVSSPQLDQAERGFSFSKEGPLDMRMDDSTGPTAEDYIRVVEQRELVRVLKTYGEERFAGRIAKAIKALTLEATPITTRMLAQVVEEQIPVAERRKMKIHPATKTFQAIRIVVNDELGELEAFLSDFYEWLRPGGRLCVISFHSLEDRIVKRRFRELEWTSRLPEKYAIEAGEPIVPKVVVVTKKPILATDAEVAANPRSRSAKLRVCERFKGASGD